MAITYPLSLPTSIGIEQITLRAVNAVSTTQSIFTYRQQVVSYAGQRWEASIRIPPLRKDVMEEWVAFLVSLKGQTGTFLLNDPNNTSPRGTASTTPGTPVVNGASQTGDTLNISGLPVSETGYLLPGDYIQLGSGSSSRLHKVLTSTDTDGSGLATVDIWPSILTAPVNGSSVVLTDAKGLFRLNSNMSEWTINNSNAYGLQFEAVGVVP